MNDSEVIELATDKTETKRTGARKGASTRASTGGTKELVPVRGSNGLLIEIKYQDGGQLPKELSGKYLSMADAEYAIKRYKARKGKK